MLDDLHYQVTLTYNNIFSDTYGPSCITVYHVGITLIITRGFRLHCELLCL